MQPLGPFQEIWDAWGEVDKEVKAHSVADFRQIIEVQIDEMAEHLANGDRKRAAYEVVDIISVALTMMRWLDLRPTEIATLAEQRAHDRMKGQVVEIMRRYRASFRLR